MLNQELHLRAAAQRHNVARLYDQLLQYFFPQIRDAANVIQRYARRKLNAFRLRLRAWRIYGLRLPNWSTSVIEVDNSDDDEPETLYQVGNGFATTTIIPNTNVIRTRLRYNVEQDGFRGRFFEESADWPRRRLM